MPLASAPPVFAYYSSNHPSTPTNDLGTSFTAGASDSDGASVSVLSALGHDVHRVRIWVRATGLTTADANVAGDLLIDPAGGTSWSVLINDLVCGFQAPNISTGPVMYDFPIWIPAGATVGWRAKTAHTADITTGFVLVEAFGEPSRPEMYWCGQGVETLGISDSKGTAITPGNAGAWGSWTSVGSTTTKHIRYIHIGVNGSDATALGKLYYFQVGVGSQVLPGSGISVLSLATTETGHRQAAGGAACNMAAGTQVQARGTASDSSPENVHVSAYGVY